jgi:hypothetical protein
MLRGVVRGVVAAVLAVLCLAAASAAFPLLDPRTPGLTETEARWLLDWAGARDAVLRIHPSEDPREINGYFSPYRLECVDFFCAVLPGPPTIGLVIGRGANKAFLIYVLLHEAGHYHQWRQGQLLGRDLVQVEWEADVWAAQAMCALGLEPSTVAAFFDFLRVSWGYEGDTAHGPAVERVANVLNSVRCHRAPEAP